MEEGGCSGGGNDQGAHTADCGEHAELLHGMGVRIDWLLTLTFELELWEWKTSDVVACLIKPATEAAGRCRFAELPDVKPFTGQATVFISHCWGGKWGDMVAACCSGARTDRVVWLDVFAVRQWPGNSADLDLRGVIARCTAMLLAVPPLKDEMLAKYTTVGDDEREEYAANEASAEYAAVRRLAPLCRLWCNGMFRCQNYCLCFYFNSGCDHNHSVLLDPYTDHDDSKHAYHLLQIEMCRRCGCI